MVPIYSLTSFLSLRFIREAIYFAVFRSTYEAFVIYSFFVLLLNYLGADHLVRKEKMKDKVDAPLPFPFGCLMFNPRSGGFLIGCQRGTLQYAIIHPITSLISVVLEARGSLCPDTFDFAHPQLFLTAIEMVSVCVAMYFLILFYITVKHDIAQHNVLMKFIAVKFVIFFSFWQSILLSLMAYCGAFGATTFFTVANISSSMQNFLICFEMLLASILHLYCFNVDTQSGTPTNPMQSMQHALNPIDLINDTKRALKRHRKHPTSVLELNDLGVRQPFQRQKSITIHQSDEEMLQVDFPSNDAIHDDLDEADGELDIATGWNGIPVIESNKSS